MIRFSSRAEVIERAILPALGAFADDFDVEGICDAGYEYKVETDADGNQLLETAGFEQVVNGEAFWALVARYDRG